MQLKQLEYLVKIAECGSITQASEQLYVSQPSLTKSIMNLEQEYGVQLLVRKPRGIELTADGRSFVHYARRVLTAANALESNFSGAQEAARSRLFLATQQLDFVYDLFLQTYADNQDRNVHYNLVETDRSDVTRQVLDGKADLGLLVRNMSDAKSFLWYTEAKHLDIYVLDQASCCAFVGPRSPYYSRTAISFFEASQCMTIALDMEPQAKQDLYFDNSDTHFNDGQMIFVNTISACERFLTNTDGLLYVSKWTIGCFQNPELHLLQIEQNASGNLLSDNELLWLKRAGEQLNPTELQFIHHLYRYFNKPVPASVR